MAIQTGKCSCCFRVDPDPAGKAAARKEAEDCIAKLHSKGWEIDLFHNMKWCWTLQNRFISLHSSSVGRYWGMMSDVDGESFGTTYWDDQPNIFNSTDPNLVVLDTFAKAKKFSDKIFNIVKEQAEALKVPK